MTIVAVIVLLGMLFAPAIGTWRESARRNHCSSNLQSLGQALQLYHDAKGELPCAGHWGAEGIRFDDLPTTVETVPVTFGNWVIELLPYLNYDDLFAKFRPNTPILMPVQSDLRIVSVGTMNCPSDRYNTSSNPFIYKVSNEISALFRRGNYAINGGPQFILETPGNIMDPRPLGSTLVVDEKKREYQWWGEGVAGFNRSFSFKDFRNGLSTTVVLDEIRAGIHPFDIRGVWSLGQINACVTWGHGLLGDAGGPNPALANADDIPNGRELHRLIGADRIREENMSFCDHCDHNMQASARSSHPGGVSVLFCDGASRFVSNSVDPSIWHVIHSRNTPKEMVARISMAKITGELTAKQKEAAPQGRLQTSSRKEEPLSFTNSVGMKLQLVRAGKFTMGSPDEGAAHNFPNDVPPHVVKISQPFYMGAFEVTQQQYTQVMGTNPSWFSGSPQRDGSLPVVGVANRPVENITWYDAVEFCRRLSEVTAEQQNRRSYRLPTEAEWEYCCRSGQDIPYKFVSEWKAGDDSGEIAHKAWRDDPPVPVPVGSYGPNAFGLHDMRGNVWEWCSDWFAHDYYSWSTSVDPAGPADGMLKVYRGSDWIYIGDNCKTASRCLPPSSRSRFIGFRVVCELRSDSS